MYIHLGQETVVKTSDVIGIFDLDTATVSKATRNYLTKAERDGDVINVTTELPKSFVLCIPEKSRKKKLYISQISSTTLVKRSGFIENL